MTDTNTVINHYSKGGLLEAIKTGLDSLGKTTNSITYQDLALVDQLHAGSLETTEKLFNEVNFDNADNIIDIGCGIGGPARYLASRFQSKVTGVDLTPEFVEVGQALTQWLELQDLVELQLGNAVDLQQFAADFFDIGYTLHAGMNIENKAQVYKEAHRILKPNGQFIIFDCMKTPNAQVSYPLPWADDPSYSFLNSFEEYLEILEQNGFEIIKDVDFTAYAHEFLIDMQHKMNEMETLPPLGLHLIVTEQGKEKFDNMLSNIELGNLAVRSIFCKKVY